MFSGHRNCTVDESELQQILSQYPGCVFVHGGAAGFDAQVNDFANKNLIPLRKYLPDYRRFGKSAPLKRNDEMLDACDILVAAYDGRKSGGTFYTVNKAKNCGKKIILLHPHKSTLSQPP
jgi:pimeloyl-ACP methyl ester carboxylesterase